MEYKYKKICFLILSILCIIIILLTGCNKSFNNYNHDDPNEKNYKTVFVDLSKLQNGEKSYALREKSGKLIFMFRRFDKNAKKAETWGYDMRSCDVSKVDLSYIESYNDVSFDSQTKFSNDSSRLPKGFDPEYILEFNKNPGLGIRVLHEQGITGKGVGIAIIDQPLLLGHEQYTDNLMSYERIHCAGDTAAMHGPAVASIAVGKDIGVAPEAKLYYIANTSGHFKKNNYILDLTLLADCILRVLEINELLPENEKIRVISISRGYTSSNKGYKELHDAIDKANNENIFVLTTSTAVYYQNFNLFGMDRDYYANPDDFDSYEPVSWVKNELYSSRYFDRDYEWYEKLILFPSGSRTYASCTGIENYEVTHDNGLSWAVPWCAGFYALCCQVKPEITPQEFINIINEISIPAEVVYEGETYNFGKIVNPEEIVKILQNQ